MILPDDLIPLQLHLEMYPVYGKVQKVEQWHQLRLLLVNLLLSMAERKPQDDVKHLLSQFLMHTISYCIARKGNWTKGRI